MRAKWRTYAKHFVAAELSAAMLGCVDRGSLRRIDVIERGLCGFALLAIVAATVGCSFLDLLLAEQR